MATWVVCDTCWYDQPNNSWGTRFCQQLDWAWQWVLPQVSLQMKLQLCPSHWQLSREGHEARQPSHTWTPNSQKLWDSTCVILGHIDVVMCDAARDHNSQGGTNIQYHGFQWEGWQWQIFWENKVYQITTLGNKSEQGQWVLGSKPLPHYLLKPLSLYHVLIHFCLSWFVTPTPGRGQTPEFKGSCLQTPPCWIPVVPWVIPLNLWFYCSFQKFYCSKVPHHQVWKIGHKEEGRGKA